jgi:guanylate kinase
MKGKIFVLSGPSGIGKDTIAQALLQDSQLNLKKIPTFTTRKPRPKEKNHLQYHFVSKEKFQKLLASGEILEYNYYHHHYYGTPKTALERTLKSGQNALLCLDINGGLSLKKIYPDAVLIFLTTGLKNIKKRLEERGANSPQEIKERLKIAVNELKVAPQYDFIVENPQGHPEKAKEKIVKIIIGEGNAPIKTTSN